MSNLIHHSSASAECYTPLPYANAARGLMGAIDLDPASSWIANQQIGAAGYCGLKRRRMRSGRYDVVLEDGFGIEWDGRVFLNPPGGRAPKGNPARTQSSAVMWWWKLASEWVKGNVEQAIFVGFTMEILSTTQGLEPIETPDGMRDVPSVLHFPFVIPSGRICFDVPRPVLLDDGIILQDVKVPKGRKVVAVLPEAKLCKTREATHANVIAFLPPLLHKGRSNVIRAPRFQLEWQNVQAALSFADIFSKFGQVRL